VKTVLFFQTAFCDSNLRQLAGVCSYARRSDWNVQVVEYSTASRQDKPDLRKLFSFWRPDGCIVDCGGGGGAALTLKDFGRIPTVFIDRHPQTIERGAVCVASDSEGIAAVAAKELLMGEFSSYAYVDWFHPHAWSTERGDAFRRAIALNGKRFFRRRILPLEGSAYLDDLANWLVTLPKPIGVFAVNDRVAGCVISAAGKVGLNVPQDIAVIGVDNDVMQCENSSVSISSISLDREGGGRTAADLLAKSMQDGRTPPNGQIRVAGLVRRASSRQFKDFRILKAVEYIRLHACEGAKIDDIVKYMGCSRTLAYRRFNAAVGHSILKEIHRIRLERAMELLREGKHRVGAISDFCGYASAVDFCRTFKRVIGQTPKQWCSTLSR